MTHLPLSIDPEHPAFDGHFPAQPIVPGVVLLDQSLRAIAVHRERTSVMRNVERCRIGAAKFLSVVRPGEPLRLEIEPSVAPQAVAPAHPGFRLRLFAGRPEAERLALSGSITFESVPATRHDEGAAA